PRIKEAIELYLEVNNSEVTTNEFIGVQQIEVSI
ncbi:MAG: type II toxin-antitoxin system HicB family antitoxin, partial [Tepidanaerobacter acetatoxydans]|nr:type II toxin-antitoxin system HicB family antitoxin [Tepidanaerobacter acetatoxydans]